ncbi:MAG TPA: methyltransferase domain-containing protein [Dehalococcoidia bacterium]|nr:methyltransferase domain-containing protein [Dehalococcoidia bacterium]
MSSGDYVHGYSATESQRLSDQANTLSGLLHYDSVFHPAGLVLEVGCGTGAQTVIVAPQNPQCDFISIDIAGDSLIKAEKNIKNKGIRNVKFQVADVFNLPFNEESFDHVFVCFLLEHLQEPVRSLTLLKKVLKKGGTITVIEGDHGSAYYYPRSSAAQATIQCLIDVQASLGGNSLIGRELYPLLVAAGFGKISVSPRIVYADASKPEMVDGFTRKTFIAMVEGVKEQAINRGLITEGEWGRGIADLYRSADSDGTFCYAFFKALGKKP